MGVWVDVLKQPRLWASLVLVLGFLAGALVSAHEVPGGKQHTHPEEDLLAESRELLKRKDFRSAEAKLRQFLARHPNHGEALLYLALSLYHLKKYPESYSIFADLADDHRLPKDYYFHAGYAAYKDGDFRRAFVFLRGVDRGYHGYDIAMYYAGASLNELRQYREALAYLKRAVVIPVAMADAKKVLVAALEQRLRKTPSKKPKQALMKKPSPAPVEPADSLRSAPSFVGLNVEYWSLDATFDPVRNVNPYGYGAADLAYKGGWDFKQGTVYEVPYGVGLDLNTGTRYSVEYLRDMLVPHGTDLLGIYRKIPLAVEGKRHDNMILFAEAVPWIEWQIHDQGKLGLEIAVQGVYGNFESGSLLGQGHGALYVHHPISQRVTAQFRGQGDFWPYLSTGSSSKYGVSLLISSQVHSFFELDVSGATAWYDFSKESHVPEQSHSANLTLRYISPFRVSVEIGGDVEYLKDYRVVPKKNALTLIGDGRRLAFVGGVVAHPWQGWKAKVSFSTSTLSWTLDNQDKEALKQWNHVVPKAQDILMAHVIWDVDLSRVSWKGF